MFVRQGKIMSIKHPHLTPHPILGRDPKSWELLLLKLKDEQETLQNYISKACNPRWSASHLVRAIAIGLSNADDAAAFQLMKIAEQLSLAKEKMICFSKIVPLVV
jgi:hypothetical protein